MEASDQQGSFQKILSEAGWVGLIVSFIVGQAGLDALLLAILEPPSADLETAKLFLSVFLLTAPLTIGVTIFAGVAFAGMLPRHPIPIAGIGLLCLAAGAYLGNALGGAVLTHQETLAVSSSGENPVSGVLAVLAKYYLAYGEAYFLASLVLGGAFGRWAALLYEKSQPGK